MSIGGDGPSAKPIRDSSRAARIAVYASVVVLLALAAVIAVWPNTEFSSTRFPNEVAFLLLVATGGALGSSLQTAAGLRHLARRTDARKYQGFPLESVVVQLLFGTPLALCVYLVVRGIVLSNSAGASALNPYGLLAISVAAGLLTRQALDKMGSIADAIAPREAVEQQMTRIESALGIGTLVNYKGFLCATIEGLAATNGEAFSEDRLMLNMGRAYVILVWFQPHPIENVSGACDRISLLGGTDVEVVQFDITVDTDVGAIRPRSGEVSFGREEQSCAVRFEFRAQPVPGNGEVWVEIAQRNRLIHSLSLPLRVAQ